MSKSIGGTPPKGTLIFDIELLEVMRTEAEQAPQTAEAGDDERPKLNPHLPETPAKPKQQGRRRDGPQTRTNPF